MSFKYVLIPAVESEPISSYEASKEGGLTNDALSKNAKQYFSDQSGTNKRAELLEKASDAEKKQIADKIRKQYTGQDATSQQVKAMSDDQIIHLLKIQEGQSASCEITCLTIPTPLNGHTAVSMYGDDHGRTKNRPFNNRATNLMMACGHAFPSQTEQGGSGDGKPNGIYGDVFVGRAIDDEARDIWERVDMTPEEVQGDLQKQPWCKIARRKGGGGGQGGAAASLSKTLQNFQNQQQGGGSNNNSSSGSAAITNGETSEKIIDEDGKNYSWTQTDDEVELKFVVPKGTKSKNVKVKFGNRSVKVSLTGIACEQEVLCEGETWDQIDVDGSTFTLQDEPAAQPTGRELCVSLEKQNPGQTWNYAIE